MNKSIELTETQVALVDIAVRKYWGRCKKLIGLTGAGHETLHQCNEVLNLLSSPHQSLDDGYYEVVDGEIKPLSWGKETGTVKVKNSMLIDSWGKGA